MKIGILGTGYIADMLSKTIIHMNDASLYAIASRDYEKAKAFKEKYNFEKAYGSYEELVKDKDVELVYIATPHSRHFEDMKLCIENHKNILCEKAFTANAKQAREVYELAKEKNVFIAEAIWTRYMPSRKLINDVLNSGIIGKVNIVTANLCYANSHLERMVKPELAGGALLDLGVYGINFALMHVGHDIERIESTVDKIETGVDGSEIMTIHYKNGMLVNLIHSVFTRSDRRAVFYGDKGYLVVENINNPNAIRAFDTNDNLIKEIEIPNQITGYEYEVSECIKCIKEGKLEPYSMPKSETIFVMEIMDKLRNSWQIKYPFEQEEYDRIKA